ncbi:MAG: PD40 domain-containing protein [Candidatus Marinimicrobia bacterium]|nr:PD40 domain-containing protein [Candidatus Neomarinimicrobiota bacterium]
MISVCISQNMYHDSRLQWSTIKSDHFSVHIPEDYVDLGIKIADICENVYSTVSHSLDYFPGRTHVVIHTENDGYYGFTSVFPWRMELMITPPQSNITGKNTHWLESLILHEFTHIVHLRKHRGLSSLTKPFIGDYNAIWQFITPIWFTEGIATLNETRFGSGGRGRNPHFWMQMAEPIYNENQWKLNNTNYYSRNKLPTILMPYISGYYMTDKINQDFGEYAWGRILNQYSSFPILSFSNAVKSVIGQDIKSTYKEVISDFKIQRNSNLSNSDSKIWYDPDILEGHYTPRWFDENNIVYYQKGISNTPQILQVKRDGDIKVLLNRRISKIDNCFAISGSKIYTSELNTAPKYPATKYSDLYEYDFKTKHGRRITKAKRLYSIDISHDRSKIIAVQTNLPNNRLALIDNNNGEILKYINFENLVVLNPRWSPSGNQITFAVQDLNGVVNIAVYNLELNKWRYIYKPNLNQDNQPCWSKDEKFIFFSSDQSGVFNIWVADVNTGDRWMITDVELGAYSPDVSPSNDEIAFSVYTENGFRIAIQNLDNTAWVHSAKITNKNKLLYTSREVVFNEIEEVEKKPYSIKQYSPLSQIIKPQGWIPYLYNEENGKGVAAYFRSEDALHRHNWYGRFGLSLNHISPTVDMTYIYSKFWPKLSFRTFSLPKKIKGDDEVGWWRETGFEYGVITPLTLENNVYNTSSSLSIQYIQNQIENSKGNIYPDKRIYRAVKSEFLFSRSSKVFRNITHYRAWFFNTKYESSLRSDYNSRRISSELDIFLPSLNKDNIELYLGYLFKSGDYEYLNDFVPVGFSSNSNDNQFRLIASYYKPLVFLEWQTPIIPIFIEYINIKPFIDYSIGWDGNIRESDIEITSSIGIELSTKNILFYRYDFEVGINIFNRSISSDIDLLPFIRVNLLN